MPNACGSNSRMLSLTPRQYFASAVGPTSRHRCIGVSVYQLKIDSLVALRDSPALALCRPPGTILLNHQRSEIPASLKAANTATRDRSDLSAAPQDQVVSDSEKSSMLVYDLGDTPGGEAMRERDRA